MLIWEPLDSESPPLTDQASHSHSLVFFTNYPLIDTYVVSNQSLGKLTTMSNIEEWIVYSTICWYNAPWISLPVTITVMTQSRLLNKTSNVTSRQKNRRTGLKKIKLLTFLAGRGFGFLSQPLPWDIRMRVYFYPD